MRCRRPPPAAPREWWARASSLPASGQGPARLAIRYRHPGTDRAVGVAPRGCGTGRWRRRWRPCRATSRCCPPTFFRHRTGGLRMIFTRWWRLARARRAGRRRRGGGGRWAGTTRTRAHQAAHPPPPHTPPPPPTHPPTPTPPPPPHTHTYAHRSLLVCQEVLRCDTVVVIHHTDWQARASLCMRVCRRGGPGGPWPATHQHAE